MTTETSAQAFARTYQAASDAAAGLCRAQGGAMGAAVQRLTSALGALQDACGHQDDEWGAALLMVVAGLMSVKPESLTHEQCCALRSAITSLGQASERTVESVRGRLRASGLNPWQWLTVTG